MACTFSAVQQCLPGYYLLNSACWLCLADCLTCSKAYSCSLCSDGFYLTSQSTCSACPVANCATCTSNGTCSLCNSGYYGATCSSICGINCAICDQSTCYHCLATYLLGAAGCEALSVLCSWGASYSSCYQCVEGIGFMSGQQCLPYHYVHTDNIQEYYTPISSPSLFPSPVSYCSSIDLHFAYSSDLLTLSITI